MSIMGKIRSSYESNNDFVRFTSVFVQLSMRKIIRMMMRLLEKFKKTNTEYNLLPFQFFLLTFWGIWLPENLPTKTKKFFQIFFYAIFLLDIIMCMEMIIFIQESIKTHSFKLINVFLTSAAMTGIYKAIMTSLNREVIRSFIKQYFDQKFFKPENSEEISIFEANSFQVRKVITIYSASMAGIFGIRAISPMISGNDKSMPVDAWYFYDVQKWYYYWLTYLQQVILGSSLICVHVGIDTLFVGLLLKLSCQIDILKYRLQKISEMCSSKAKSAEHYKVIVKNMIFECIEQHQAIYRFGKGLNVLFQDILIIQVITSIPNLCINIFVLSTDTGDIDIDYISILFNTTSSLLQLFISCWYGNEVILNSLDLRNAIFNVDWTELDLSTRKIFIIQMLRSSKPIEFTVGYIIPMNINSFIKIIKTSYSAFNLLHQT